ncbi:hypothetical protein H6S82_14070 [Planktothrix sp. FACHB-1355]|uniref:Uncharacterized protein n=1 Tax=Aerosakkonema funiforme FACHB-1375 TaxID=2949571 RepID=A0A926VMF8_9CYAN|nr:hypothetical protein [Aerosakkonema funiforme FACHB-1375]MBD3559977.1 hypothetical protein [Planktothrix sp. FACHB-1355]
MCDRSYDRFLSEYVTGNFQTQYYQEKHGTNPPKLANRKIPVSSYPGVESIELSSRTKVIDTV